MHLNLTESKAVRSVSIKFTGDSRTEWFKEERDELHRERTKRRYYRGHENFLTREFRLFGQNSGTRIDLLQIVHTIHRVFLFFNLFQFQLTVGQMEIERGEHIYDFQFRLPAGLPSSFEGEYGFIRYIATVVLDIPRWPDDEFQQPFTVIKPLDLNDAPELRVIILFPVCHLRNSRNHFFFFAESSCS